MSMMIRRRLMRQEEVKPAAKPAKKETAAKSAEAVKTATTTAKRGRPPKQDKE